MERIKWIEPWRFELSESENWPIALALQSANFLRLKQNEGAE
jgi:hypothetical protein